MLYTTTDCFCFPLWFERGIQKVFEASGRHFLCCDCFYLLFLFISFSYLSMLHTRIGKGMMILQL